MNLAVMIGYLTRDPEVRYTDKQLAITRFSVALDRGKDKNGEDRGADFPNVLVFGRMAENCEKYLQKGSRVGVQGRIQTGSYTNKDGNKVYTTEVIADRVEFLNSKSENENYTPKTEPNGSAAMPDGFREIDEEIPF